MSASFWVRIVAKAACLLIHFPLSAVGPDRHRSRVGGISVLRSPVERVGARSAMYICAGLRTGLAHPSAEGVGVTRTSSGSSSCPDRAGDPEERRDVLSRLESEHDHGGGDLSIPVLESAAEKADQEQGQALGGPGAHEGFGGDSATSTRSVRLRFHSMKKLPQDSELKADAVFPWMLTVTPALHQSLQSSGYLKFLISGDQNHLNMSLLVLQAPATSRTKMLQMS